MDVLELCCLQDHPVAPCDIKPEHWERSGQDRLWFASDRYNFLYVRVRTQTNPLPWNNRQVSLTLTVSPYNEQFHPIWKPLISMSNATSVKLVEDSTRQYLIGKEAFLIPPLFSGSYVIVAEYQSGGSAPTQQFLCPIPCHSTPPCVWEECIFLPAQQSGSIRLCPKGGTWQDGSFAFLSNHKGVHDSLCYGTGSGPIPMTDDEYGVIIPSIQTDNLLKLKDLEISVQRA